jgi:excinuclease ABC subunit A
LAIQFKGISIDQATGMQVDEARHFFESLSLSEQEWKIGETLIKEIRDRLRFLDEVGLGYLNLDRRADSLSGGEAQRIRLAACVGSGLQGVTYVLDEPSIGLHPRDNRRLLGALEAVRDLGNTVVVVEHDRETMEHANKIIDIGPGAGRFGGRLVGQGSPEVFSRLDSTTARFLRDEERIEMPYLRRSGSSLLLLSKARAHNLKGFDVRFPLGTMTVLTGVSGSGKSTLLFEELEARLKDPACPGLKGEGPIKTLIDKVVEIDQKPIGRTPRSNPATYSGAFDLIRDLFAALPESVARGYPKGRFSFNVAGGRCESCEGAGVRTIEMQFLADVEILCEACGGRRFNQETLEITWKGQTIADILAMTIGEAVGFFSAHPKLHRILAAMAQVGLDYLQLGQSATTLSGGEAQRLKLATELQRPATGKTLYLMDEPTTGLHFQDVRTLLGATQALVDAGNTVVVIEHNTDWIKVADYLIELGPEGGSQGGELVACGTPEEVARLSTATGKVLAALPEFGAAPAVFTSRSLLMQDSAGADLVVEGARHHNLKNIHARIPFGKMTVVTGVSGSGKTSFAFDTIFAEGQRRYVEALSTYARRFLGRLERPLVDRISGLAPAIAIDQKNSSHNPRSTVATVTEIHDHFRLLWSNLGVPYCPRCDAEIRAMPPGVAAVILAARTPGKGRILARLPEAVAAAELIQRGFARGWLRGREVKLEELAGNTMVSEVVVDRFDPAEAERIRVAESIGLAYKTGKTRFLSNEGEAIALSLKPECPNHGQIHKDPLTPRHFSFNHYLGACGHCNGLGREPWTTQPCPRCEGRRLKPEILSVRFAGKGLAEVGAMTIGYAARWFHELLLTDFERVIAEQPLREIRTRLKFLVDVGLGYLTLDRGGDTLSGGESQRIRLASQLGSGLTGCLYVLDEPTVGLHPRDTQALLKTLEGLRSLGNTLVVVEHDPETIRRADLVLDLGPEAGDRGGELVASGPPSLLGEQSITGPWLKGLRQIPVPSQRRLLGPAIAIRKATAHNLKNLDVDLPTRCLVGITGVSGSGKSTLIMELLVGALKKIEEDRLGLSVVTPQLELKLPGILALQVIDQEPIGRSPRSTPATYTKVLDPIRELFAEVPLAKERGYESGRFSYNNKEGSCRHCEGHGQLQIEMHFLSNVWVVCEKCRGRRYNRETLDIRWKGRSIADILELRVDEALELFTSHKRIARPLQALTDVGLGYLKLGQPATELSGGEAQRIKLAGGLQSRNKSCLYILDEPTTGLHLSDVDRLVRVLDRLVEAGNSVVVVEHHLDVIRHCDYLVDLGPEAGEGGGRLVGAGSPEALMQVEGSHTGRALRNVTISAGSAPNPA